MWDLNHLCYKSQVAINIIVILVISQLSLRDFLFASVVEF